MKANLITIPACVCLGLSYLPLGFGADVSLKPGDTSCIITDAVTDFKGRGLIVEPCGLRCNNASKYGDLIFIHDPDNPTDVCKINGTLHVVNADKVTICSGSGMEVTGSVKGPDEVIFSALGKGEIDVRELQQSYNDPKSGKKVSVVVQNFTKVQKVKNHAAIFDTTTTTTAKQTKKGKKTVTTTRRGIVMEYHVEKGALWGAQQVKENTCVTYDSATKRLVPTTKGKPGFKDPEVIPGILIVPVAPVAPAVVPKAVPQPQQVQMQPVPQPRQAVLVPAVPAPQPQQHQQVAQKPQQVPVVAPVKALVADEPLRDDVYTMNYNPHSDGSFVTLTSIDSEVSTTKLNNVVTPMPSESEYMGSEEKTSPSNRGEMEIKTFTTTTAMTTSEESAYYDGLEGSFRSETPGVGMLKAPTESSYDDFGILAPKSESTSALDTPEHTPSSAANGEALVTMSQETKSMPELPSWSSSSNPLLDIEQLTREDIPEEILKEMKSIAENQPSVTDFNA
ncbi:MAG: hypothetical protein ACSW8C_01880 [bacterium]